VVANTLTIKKRDELGTPVWVGETGEKGNAIYWGTSQYLAAHHIGFSFWPWKKMDTENTPCSIKKPADWDLIAEYTKGGPKPDSTRAEKALNELLENIQLSRCVYFQDVVHAIFNRIPAKIEAENYGHEGYGRSYFVVDRFTMSKFYRINEPVQVLADSRKKDQRVSEQSITLQGSEWVAYNCTSLENREYHLTMKASAPVTPAQLVLWINSRKVNCTVTDKEPSEMRVGNFPMEKGDNRIKILVKSNSLTLDWLRFDDHRPGTSSAWR